MDLVFVITSLQGGGAERVVINLATWWSKQGYSVAIVTLFGVEHDAYYPPDGVKRIALNLDQPSTGLLNAVRANIVRTRALRAVLKSLAPEVVVAFLTETNVLTILASAGLGHRVVVAERIHPPRHLIPTQWRWLRKIVYRHANRIIALTQPTADWLKTNTGSKAITVIPNIVNWPIKSSEPVVLPDTVLKPDDLLVLAVGRLSQQKGFDLLIEAYARIAVECPKWKLVIAGDDVAEESKRLALTELIERHHLQERIVLPGRVGNMAQWYHRCDMFVLSSRYEGFPNVLLEAMSCGCASVSFACDTGPADAIEQGVNGLLVKPEDVEGLAAAMRSIMLDPHLRCELGKKAESVRDRFSEDVIMQQWVTAVGLSSPSTNGGH